MSRHIHFQGYDLDLDEIIGVGPLVETYPVWSFLIITRSTSFPVHLSLYFTDRDLVTHDKRKSDAEARRAELVKLIWPASENTEKP